MNTENVSIIGEVALDECGHLSVANVIDRLKKEIERNYLNYRIIDDDTVGVENKHEAYLRKWLAKKYDGKCAVFIKGLCRDVNFIFFFRVV